MSIRKRIGEKFRFWAFINDLLIEGKNPFAYDIGADERELTNRLDKKHLDYINELLFDRGWVRVIEPKNPEVFCNKTLKFDIIAYDVLGGFFVIDKGYFADKIGLVYYMSPETLEWMSLGIGYKEFLSWLNCGNLALFYRDERWIGWQEEIKDLPKDKVFEFNPPLWSQNGSVKRSLKRVLSLEETWNLNMLYQSKLGISSYE